jgi:hypothetical protein
MFACNFIFGAFSVSTHLIEALNSTAKLCYSPETLLPILTQKPQILQEYENEEEVKLKLFAELIV